MSPEYSLLQTEQAQLSLLAQVKLFARQDACVLLSRAALEEFFSRSARISGIAPTQVQHPTLDLVESHEVHMLPPR